MVHKSSISRRRHRGRNFQRISCAMSLASCRRSRIIPLSNATFSQGSAVLPYISTPEPGGNSVKCDESGENGDAKTGKVRERVLYISAAEILSLLKNFDFIDSFTDFRPLQVASDLQLLAVNSLLHEISFYDYLNIEKNYQLFMLKQEDRFLLKMAHLMYRTAGGSSDETANFEPYELLGVFMWFSSVKEYFAANFPHFFRPAKEGGELRREDILPAMQAQIRALTDGDVTKLQAVYNTDCWAALTELDNKAREAEEFKKRNRQNN